MNPNQTDTVTITGRTDVLALTKSAVDKMVNLIKPTFGPANNKVIISTIFGEATLDDGVQIARDFKLSCPKENAIVKRIREAAITTNDRVGDSTTNSLIATQAFVTYAANHPEISGREIEAQLKKGLAEFKVEILKLSREVKTKEELKKVARIAFDNEEIAELISGLYFELGKDATITLDKSSTMDTYAVRAGGIKIERGYLSPYMVTDGERMEAVIENPYILITDYRITEVNDILPIMDKMNKTGKRELVVICENMEGDALSLVVVNKLQGKFLTLVINAPSENRKNVLEDMALLTGAYVFSNDKGDKLEKAELKQLGRAERFICKKDESVIVGPRGDKKVVQGVVAELRAGIESEKDSKTKKALEQRLGMFTNSIVVVKVGAPTEQEQKALKYKVEDTVNAVKTAFHGGVIPGGGFALARIKTSSFIFNAALREPIKQIALNMGLIDYEIPDLKKNEVYNFITGKTGDFLKVGVLDPTDAIVAGMESAVSVSSVLLSATGMVVETLKEQPKVQ